LVRQCLDSSWHWSAQFLPVPTFGWHCSFPVPASATSSPGTAVPSVSAPALTAAPLSSAGGTVCIVARFTYFTPDRTEISLQYRKNGTQPPATHRAGTYASKTQLLNVRTTFVTRLHDILHGRVHLLSQAVARARARTAPERRERPRDPRGSQASWSRCWSVRAPRQRASAR
jgi:hypothetical protein